MSNFQGREHGAVRPSLTSDFTIVILRPMIKTAPLYASAYPKRHWKERRECLTHAIEFDADGEVVRALCGKVQPESVHDDATLHTDHAPTCKQCLARWKKISS